MKNQLNRELIEDLNESNNEEFIKNINDTMLSLVSTVLSDLEQKSPFVKAEKCVFQAVNEAYLATFSQLSEFSYFFGIDNPQIELNTKDAKNWFKFLWREFKANFRLGKKKYKKKKHQTAQEPVLEQKKYKLSDLKHDFVEIMSNYLSETSIIYEYHNKISIIGKDDFGTNVRINIYFCCFDSRNQVFKMYKENKNKFVSLSFGSRFDNLLLSIEKNDCFVDMIKIFNAIYSKNYNKIPNQILLESLIFNCPKNLFDSNNIYNTFVNVANYIRITNPSSMMSICDTSKTIFQEDLIVKSNQQVEYSKIVRMLDNFKF